MIPYNTTKVVMPLGNIGDTLMCLPVARFIARNPIYGLERGASIYTNFSELVVQTDIADECEILLTHSPEDRPTILLRAEVPRHGRYHPPCHRTDEAFWYLGYGPDDIPIEEKNLPRYKRSPFASKKFDEDIVVVAGTFPCRRRKFSDRVMFRLLKYLKRSGYLPVIVGATKHITGMDAFGVYNVNYDVVGCVNLINKLSFGQLLAVMDEAKAVVGPDGGILHMAGLTDTPIVGYYTIISHEYVAPIRNNMVGGDCVCIDAPLTCSSCYSRTDQLWLCTEDYTNDLIKGYNKEGDADCVKSLHTSLLIEGLQGIGIK